MNCRILTFLSLLCGLALSGCAGADGSACREYKICCGMSSERGEVSEDAWRSFCDRHVSAAFPDGYTVVDATGYWRGDTGSTAKERAKIILVIAPADAREKVLSVARRYRKEFAQECVLVSSSDADMESVRAKDRAGK